MQERMWTEAGSASLGKEETVHPVEAMASSERPPRETGEGRQGEEQHTQKSVDLVRER